MPAPTFVADYQTALDSTTWPRTQSVTTSVGDILVAAALAEEWGTSADDFLTPTGGTNLTWALKQQHQLTLNSIVFVWTATATTSESFTFSVNTNGGTKHGGVDVVRFSNSSGIGNTVKGNAGPGSAPSLAITTTADNSLIVAWFIDWSETDPTGRTWRTINSITPAAGSGEIVFADISFQAAYYGAYWSDAGGVGSKTTGMTVPTQKWVGVAVEVKGGVADVPVLRSTGPGIGGPMNRKQSTWTFFNDFVLLSATDALAESAAVTATANNAAVVLTKDALAENALVTAVSDNGSTTVQDQAQEVSSQFTANSPGPSVAVNAAIP